MDKIVIKGLKVFAYHGVNPEEKVDGQNFVLDITAYRPLKDSCLSDDIEDTVSYAKIIKTAVRVMKESKYDLLERAAHRVVEQIFLDFESIQKIDICLKKPEAPIKADFDYVGVELSRSRGDFE